jgi:hypothetical protein
MNRKSIKKLAKIYSKMSQEATDQKEKKRLAETAEALDRLLAINSQYDKLCKKIDELISCDILTDQSKIKTSIKSGKKQVLK